jgi:uncharacterized protein YndB with AHSA1/START domain
MRELSTTVELRITAPPHDIWAYRLDFCNLPRYNPSVRGIERVEAGGPDGVGARYRFDLDMGGGSHPIELEVTRVEPDHLVAIDMGGPLPAREVFTVSAPSPDEGRGPGTPSSCLVAIALTLLVPDTFPASADPGLVAGGRQQMLGELEQMAAILQADPAGSTPA